MTISPQRHEVRQGFGQYLDSSQQGLSNDVYILHAVATNTGSRLVNVAIHFP